MHTIKDMGKMNYTKKKVVPEATDRCRCTTGHMLNRLKSQKRITQNMCVYPNFCAYNAKLQ